MPELEPLKTATSPAAPIRVLLVDDHQILRKGLRRLLETDPQLTVVGEAANGRTAVELACQLKPQVVVMDISMPEMNGLDATSEILSRMPEIRVVGLSMLFDDELVKQMVQAGAMAFLTKDCAEKDLVAAVHSVMAGQSYFSAGITRPILDKPGQAALPGQPRASITLEPKERQLVRLVATGKNTKQNADCLGLSPKTIDIYRHRLMQKLRLGSVVELTKYAIREGLTSVGR
jgi:DNA-binding NarL/FixJ family response regulator